MVDNANVNQSIVISDPCDYRGYKKLLCGDICVSIREALKKKTKKVKNKLSYFRVKLKRIEFGL